MKRGLKITLIFLGIIILVGALVGAGYFLKNIVDSSQDTSSSERVGTTSKSSSPGSSSSGDAKTSKPAATYEKATAEDFVNFETILAKNAMIQDLPDSGILMLSFYNFDSGSRTWDKEYTLTKGNVAEGVPSEYDLKLVMHSKYLTVFNANNFCSVIQTAKNNGDFGTETEMSTTSLLWKYKSMNEYKDCLGF